MTDTAVALQQGWTPVAWLAAFNLMLAVFTAIATWLIASANRWKRTGADEARLAAISADFDQLEPRIGDNFSRLNKQDLRLDGIDKRLDQKCAQIEKVSLRTLAAEQEFKVAVENLHSRIGRQAEAHHAAQLKGYEKFVTKDDFRAGVAELKDEIRRVGAPQRKD